MGVWRTALASLAVIPAAIAAAAGSGHEIATVAEGLERPYGIAFVSANHLLITEKPGRLRVVEEGRLLTEKVGGIPEVYPGLQGGLLDVVLHPDFERNGRIFLSLTAGDNRSHTLKVIRGTYRGSALDDVQTVFEALPHRDTGAHFGGRMAFLPDHTLLVTVGDGYQQREQAQRLDGTLGKVVRVREDGGVPNDNPFAKVANAAAEVYSYGHRHPQGIVYDPVRDRIYAHEHGPMGGDELNVIFAGKNYGWPIVTGGLDYSGALVSPLKKHAGMEEPLLEWTPSLAPSGLAQCRSCLWPEWEGDLFVGMLAGRQVRRVRIPDSGHLEEHDLFTELGSRIRHLKFGPDGALYLLLDDEKGQVLRVRPAAN